MSEPVARTILKKGVLFAEAPDSDIDDVLETGHEVSYDAEQVIFAEATNVMGCSSCSRGRRGWTSEDGSI